MKKATPKEDKDLETPPGLTDEEKAAIEATKKPAEEKPVDDRGRSELEKKFDELRSNYRFPQKSFVALVGGDFGRVVNKMGQWVSPVLPRGEATRLSSSMNVKDPEQKRYNFVKGQGNWSEGPNERPQ